jgi:hypothetical protein
MPTRTPSNGLETANQNETFQAGVLAVKFVFMLFSQAFKDRRFRKFEIFLGLRLALRLLLIRDCGRRVLISPVRSKAKNSMTTTTTTGTALIAKMSKTKRIGATLITCLSGAGDRQSEHADQNTNQRT